MHDRLTICAKGRETRMGVRIAINGFGRIGRMVYRQAIELRGIEVVAVNGTADAMQLAHLLKYDSIHGTWPYQVQIEENGWFVNGQFTQVFSTRDPALLPWGALGIDVVVDATGQFRTREMAQKHLRQGAKNVLITAPAESEEDADITLVYGVNEDQYDHDKHHIVSGASCTTNCLGPVVKVLHETFGIESGLVTTVHAYTYDQKNLDNPHKDLRRARSCGQSIIPTSTGAAKAIGMVIPDLRGKLNGLSLRVPTPNVSIVDLVVQLQSNVTREVVNHTLRTAAECDVSGVLGYTDAPLVSIDFNGDAHSAVVDSTSTMVINGNTLKVLAWYDNEWGYSARMVDLLQLIGTPLCSHASVVQ